MSEHHIETSEVTFNTLLDLCANNVWVPEVRHCHVTAILPSDNYVVQVSQSVCQSICQCVSQSDRQTDRQTDKHTDRQTDRLTERQSVGHLVGQ